MAVAYTNGQIYDALNNYYAGSNHPDLLTYRDKFKELSTFDSNNEAMFWRLRYFCKLGKFYKSRILEVGCGFGWDALAVSMIGDNHVVASDILPSMVDGMTECIEASKAKGKSLKITPLLGDICTMRIQPDSFDAIFCCQAVEHVHSLETMFDNCRSILKPGGRMVIVNDNNVHNTEIKNSITAMWKERDGSWEHAEYLKTVRPVEHANAKPYAAMREAIIKEADPAIDQDHCNLIVKQTAGLTKPDIIEASKRIRFGGEWPSPPPFAWCRNPETGEYAERLLDPFELSQMLKVRGFKVRLTHAFRRFPIRLANKIQFAPLNKYLFNLRPVFVIVAEKL